MRGRLENLTSQTLFLRGRTEIIVIDSASSQNEKAIVQDFQKEHDNISYFRTSQRESLYKAWNRAIKIAAGEYITNANTDDRL